MAPVGKYFNIKSRYNGLYLDVKQGATIPGSQVLLWNKQEEDNQVWYEDPRTGTIRCRHSHLCLDVNANNRLVVNIYQADDKNQQWRFNRDKQTFENRLNSFQVLEVVGGSKSGGAEIGVFEFDEKKETQQWRLETLSIRYFYIRSELNGKVLDIAGSKSSAGAKVILYAQKIKSADNQLWFEDAQGNIRSKLNAKLVLDGTGTVVHTGNYAEGNLRQFWMISGNRIVNRHNHNEVVDIRDAKSTEDLEICVSKYHGGDYQHWKFDYTN